MFLLGAAKWWYVSGWVHRYSLIAKRLQKVLDFFSFASLLKTFFAPFKQISAASVGGDLNIKTRAFFDKLLSRVIGMVMRTFLLVFGLVAIVFELLIGFIIMIIWPLVPIFPVIGVFLYSIGWLL